MIRRAATALLVGLALALAPGAPASAAPADDIHALVNEARWANGQAGLIRNAAMDQVAADWAATMAANGAISHNPDYSSQIPGGWTAAAENVAQGHPTGAAMHDGWMNSSGHRANILGDYTDVGIAFLTSGGTTWGVQVFARYSGHVGPAAPAPPPPPAPAPPGEPDPGETPPAAPTAHETPRVDTSAPSARPMTTPTPSATPERDPVAAGPAWWALVAGAVAVASAAVSTIIRRRTPS